MTIDQGLLSCELDHVDFIKLDIEGAEELALRGSESLIAKSQPIIVFEVHPRACSRLNLAPAGVIQLLLDLGYEIHRLDQEGGFISVPPLSDSSANYVALPWDLG